MKLTIETGWHLSLADLTELRKQGYSLIRTNHLGNLPPRDIVLLDLGFKSVLFDRNICAPRILKGANGARMDTTFLPESICVRGNRDIIAEPKDNTLAAVLPITHAHWIIDELGGSYFSPSAVHYASLKKCFGEAITTESQYWVAHRDMVDKLMNAAMLKKWPYIDRLVRDGEVVKIKERPDDNLPGLADLAWELNYSLADIAADGKSRECSGALYGNALAIGLMTAIEAVLTGKNKVYQLSGRQMIQYMSGKEYQERFQTMFKFFADRSGLDLPEELTIVVVPTAAIAPFISLPGEPSERTRSRAKMADLLNTLEKLQTKLAQKQRGSNSYQTTLKGMENLETTLPHKTLEYAHPCFADGHHAACELMFSHYDMIGQGSWHRPRLDKEFQQLNLRTLDNLARGLKPQFARNGIRAY